MGNWNRRDVLKSLGITAGASLLLPDLFSSAIPEKSFKLDFSLSHKAIPKPVTAITLGAGGRGNTYGNYALEFPDELNIVGVAEPIPFRNNKYTKLHKIEEKYRFKTWEDVFKIPKFADAIIISTPDALHYKPCMTALDMGYEVLLEKPIARSIKECTDIRNKALKLNRIVAVCHVLRYAPYFRKMKDVIRSGEIGEIISIQHLEPIEHIHMSHSYVRGNWHNSRESTPIILGKSCHDLDILNWLTGKSCKSVFAMGGLKWFKYKNAPSGAPSRCTDGCPAESECVFSAEKIYLKERTGWEWVLDLPEDKSKHEAHIMEKLRTTNYGRCVYQMDNDQPDHYIAAMEYDDDITVSFSMEAFTSYGGRRTRVMGTLGDIVGDMNTMDIYNYRSKKSTRWDSSNINDVENYKHSGHGGGDWRLVHDFVQAVAGKDKSLLVSTIEESVESHIIGFKAEESRKSNKMIRI
ncbi:MAG: Gfo/Idh/MocA family protein [Deltaproteobacteria bacterium]